MPRLVMSISLFFRRRNEKVAVGEPPRLDSKSGFAPGDPESMGVAVGISFLASRV